MCNQAVSLVAGELEKVGVTTVVIQLLRDVARKVQPPRALFVPFKHGFPLDRPNEADRQRRVIEAALDLFEITDRQPPLLIDYALSAE